MARSVQPAVAILMDVARGDQRRRRKAEPRQQRPARRRIDKAAGHRGLVGRLVEQRHVQEQRELARAQPNVQAHLDGKQIVKEVVVPGKLVNIVVR